jgi:hypothetical protein
MNLYDLVVLGFIAIAVEVWWVGSALDSYFKTTIARLQTDLEGVDRTLDDVQRTTNLIYRRIISN